MAPTPPRPRPGERRTMPAGHAIVVVLVALGLGSVLNAPALADAASRRPFGWQRTLAVVAVAPVQGLAGLLHLDRPHRLLAEAAAEATVPGGGAGSVPVVADGAGVATAQGPAGGDAADAPAGGESTVRDRPREAAASRRAGTRRDPLRVWIGGDSMASEFAPALADRLARTGRAEATVDFRYSTGLARPDFFDWPAQLARVLRAEDPDAVVAVFGANDGQNLQVGDTVLTFGSPGWRQEYARRVGTVMDRVARKGRTLYWVGQPVMRSQEFDARMTLLNDIYRAEARRRRAVVFVDTAPLFSAPGGGYAPVLPDGSGGSTLMRQQDGVHLTRAGGERLAAVLMDRIAERWPVVAGDG